MVWNTHVANFFKDAPVGDNDNDGSGLRWKPEEDFPYFHAWQEAMVHRESVSKVLEDKKAATGAFMAAMKK